MAQKHGFTGHGGLKLRTEAGVVYWLWVDSSGNLRISSAKPTTQDSDGNIIGGSALEATAIPDYAITWTAATPTAGSTNTIDNGGTVGDDNEGGQAIADITAKLNLILAALRTNGIVAA